MDCSPAEIWLHARVSPEEPATLTPQRVAEVLESLAAENPALRLACLGASWQGRAIRSATIGVGPRRILAWSQMHGDEPTHTAVLLDLLAWLVRGADDPTAASILAGCTLTAVPMLNPDGAVLGTRHNAQGIDVNRDARCLQSPEGRILRDLVVEFQPAFAFNLHNQNARAAVGRSRLPSVAALMTPPVDLADTQTDQTRCAKQVAVAIRDAVEPYCPGMVSRYSAGYMPRAFGEWVQGAGAATVLIEAGGMPADAQFDMVALHTRGLARGLAAIAADGHLKLDPGRYGELPLDGEISRFDRIVRSATICARADAAGFVADVGINFPGGQRLANAHAGGGLIEEIGDLDVSSGKQSTDAEELVCRPGRWAFSPATTPSTPVSSGFVGDLLSCGVTTLMGTVDANDDRQFDALHTLRSRSDLPLNLAFLTTWTDRAPAGAKGAALRLLLACKCGAYGVLRDCVPLDVREHLSNFALPFADSSALVGAACPRGAALLEPANLPAALREGYIPQRGVVAPGAVADLAFWTPAAAGGECRGVLVGGVPAYVDRTPTGELPGVLLTHC